MSRRIAFATCLASPLLSDSDALAAAALEKMGIEVEAVPWQAEPAAWEACDLIVIRSAWDYPENINAFLDWIARLEQKGAPLLNPPQAVRWNIDKAYLLELEQRGCAITPTVYIPCGRKAVLEEAAAEKGWNRFIIKPSVGADGEGVQMGSRESMHACQAAAAEILVHSGLLIQEFMPEVPADGELSLVFFENRFSHAVQKRPKAGDFRANVDRGAAVAACSLPRELIDQAGMALRKSGQEWLYARVDGVRRARRFLVSEVELIEPSLYFYCDPSAADRFAACLRRRL